MEERDFIVDGQVYVQLDAFCFGDYDNSSDVNRANYRALVREHGGEDELPSISFSAFHHNSYTGSTEFSSFDDEGDFVKSESLNDCDIILTRGEMGGTGLLIKKFDEDGNEAELYVNICQSLHNYPLYASDDILHEVQEELKQEAFHDYGESDLSRMISKDPESFGIKADEDWDISDHPVDNKLEDLWNRITHHETIEGVYESSGYYVDLDKDEVKKEISAFIEELDSPKAKKEKTFSMR
jgi:hypothetical protein